MPITRSKPESSFETMTQATDATTLPADVSNAAADATGAAVDATRNAAEKTSAYASRAADTTAAAFQGASAKVETIVAETQKTVTEQMEKMSKGFEGMTAFSQENMDALVKSSEIAAKAAEGIGSEVSAYSKKAFEDAVAAAQDLASAKTMTELFEKQTAFAQSAFEGYVAQTTKMHEIFVAVTKDVTAPIGARVSAATEKMKSFAL